MTTTQGMSDEFVQVTRYELQLASGRVVTWAGENGEDAARKAADCLRVAVVAWRTPRIHIGPVHLSQIIG